MLSELLTALEYSALVIEIRSSIWLYPMINTGHIIGVALLAGGSIPVNLLRLGVWKSVPMSRLKRFYAGTAGAGLIVAVICGILLFMTAASIYAKSSIFISKMLLLLAGIVIEAILYFAVSAGTIDADQRSGALPVSTRILAGTAILVWLSVLTLGRLIAYF